MRIDGWSFETAIGLRETIPSAKPYAGIARPSSKGMLMLSTGLRNYAPKTKPLLCITRLPNRGIPEVKQRLATVGLRVGNIGGESTESGSMNAARNRRRTVM